MSNGFFRKKKVYFTQVSNTALRDKKLTLKAKGLYAIIQSYITIEDFTLYKSTLEKQCKEKRDAFNGAWKELKDNGYLIQYKYKNEKGTFNYEYELLDIPQLEEVTEEEKTTDGKSTHGKSTCGKSTHGKPSMYNNTDSNNTDLNNTDITTQLPVSSINKELENKNLIETYTHLKLSNNMIKQISKWDYERLGQAIKIFIEKEGKYFAMLKKIYQDDGNFIKKNTPSSFEEGINPKSFNNFAPREYDYDELEKKLLGWDKE